MNPDTTTEVARLREELDRFKLGFQGSCYACEPVGEMNHKLEAEVARLREVCEWAADMMDGIRPARGQEIRDAIARLAPAPEETQDGAMMAEWYGGFAKIESTEPKDEVSKIKEMVMDAARRGDEMAAHWKERAEKAEAIIKQLHHYAGIIEGFQNPTK